METIVRYCKCGVQIPAARLKILPNTHTCVNCSDVKTKKPVIVQHGQGDHTYIETIFLEHEDYVQYVEEETKLRKRMGIATKSELLDFDNESSIPNRIPSTDSDSIKTDN
jgi:hypothetical protein